MPYKRHLPPFILLLTALLSLAACGSSSSAGATIIYVGEQRISISQSRITSPARTTTFRIDRNGDQVTMIGQNFRTTATLTGEDFSLTSPLVEVNINGSRCSYSITYRGRLSQSEVSGTLNGPLDCGLTGSLSGDFEAVAVSGDRSTVIHSVSALLGI